jgi:hypothetical protein
MLSTAHLPGINQMNDVTHFGAKGDGKTDDTAALQHAIDQTTGLIEFPSGTFLIKKTLVVDLSKKGPMSIRGAAGSTSIVMKGPGPAFRLTGSHKGTADPKSWTDKTRLQERFPNITGIEIRGEHPDAVGIELVETAKPTIQNVFIRECRVGIHVRQRNRDILIADSHIYNNEDYGLFLDHVNLHQMNICGCHISYNKAAAIAMIGGDLHNLQFTGNDIEYSHSFDLKRPDSADVLIDARNGIASEITFASNTSQGKASVNGANVRILGRLDQDGFPSARLIAITGNILGSQSTSIQMQYAQRVTLTGNTIYDGHTAGLSARDCDGLVIANNVHGWSHQPKSPRPDHYQLENCVGVTITGEVFQNAGGERGEVIRVSKCRDIALGQLVIRNPKSTGIIVENSSAVAISGCVISAEDRQQLASSIEITGNSRDILISGNVLAKGMRGDVAGAGEQVTLSGNRSV